MQTIPVKILGSKRSQRYSIARAMIQAKATFEKEHPEFELDITQVTTSQEILKYTPVFAYPSLMIGDKLVCVGRFPTKVEILGWLETEIQQVGAV
jgi:hypothetical protein